MLRITFPLPPIVMIEPEPPPVKSFAASPRMNTSVAFVPVETFTAAPEAIVVTPLDRAVVPVPRSVAPFSSWSGRLRVTPAISRVVAPGTATGVMLVPKAEA